MELAGDEIIQKYAKDYGHCSQNTLLPYEYEWICISCGFNLIKRKQELSKISKKIINFITRLNYAEQKMFCICIEVYQLYESNDYDKIIEVLSTLKRKKLKVKNILFEKSKDILEILDFEKEYWSRKSTGVYKIGYDSVRLKKSLTFYDKYFYGNVNYYDLMGSISTIK